MYSLITDQNAYNLNTYQKSSTLLDNNDIISSQYAEEVSQSKLDESSVSIAISTHSVQNYINSKSAEFSKSNTNAQQLISNLTNDKFEYLNFFENKKFDKESTKLEDLGYLGKPISQLSKEEAKNLLDTDGFFGSDETSKRLSVFAEEITGFEPEALKEVKKGFEKGFEEAKKFFKEDLPEVSKQTQFKTMDIIDKKIEEMLKTDFQKELETKHLNEYEK